MAVLGEYAADQWGLITSAQATNAGVDAMTLNRLAAAGTITQVIRGVYQLAGSSHAQFITEAAAWLRLDPATPAWEREPLDADSGVLSHRSAALIHGIGDLRASSVEFIVPRYRRTRDATIRLHQAHLDTADITSVDDFLPVTTVERTLADLFAEHLDGGHASDLLTDALANHTIDKDDLARRLAPHAARYGAPAGDGHAVIKDLTRNLVTIAYSNLDDDRLRGLRLGPIPPAEVKHLLARWHELTPHLAEAEAIAERLRTLNDDSPQKGDPA